MTVARDLAPRVRLAFAPLHKSAFGVACGAALGFFIFLITLVGVTRPPEIQNGLSLLSEYYAGYHVTVAGAFIGLAWGFVSGFVMGWFMAFMRNMSLAGSIFWIRTRAELNETRDFLDHI